MFISKYLSNAIFQYLLFGFWGVGGERMVGSILVTRILFGFTIGILGVSVGEKFISPVILVIMRHGSARLSLKS